MRTLLVLSWLCLGFCTSFGLTQDTQDKKPEAPSLSLKVSAEQYLLDQPIRVFVSLKNTTSKAFQRRLQLGSVQSVKLELRHEDSSWALYESNDSGITVTPVPGEPDEPTEPGASVSVEGDLWRTVSKHPLLDKPGKWSMRVSCVWATEDYWKKRSEDILNGKPVASEPPRIESPVIEFTIIEPGGKDALARQAMEQAKFFPKYFDQPPQYAQKELVDLYEKYSDSGYGGDIAAYLADSYAKNGPWQSKEALAIIDRFRAEWANHQQAPHALLMRAAKLARPEPTDLEKQFEKEEETQRRIRNNKEASDFLKMIEEKYPWCTSLETFTETKATLEGKERKKK